MSLVVGEVSATINCQNIYKTMNNFGRIFSVKITLLVKYKTKILTIGSSVNKAEKQMMLGFSAQLFSRLGDA